MIIDKKTQPKENDIISIRLISSEEVVAKFIKQDEHYIHIKNPLTLSVGPDGKVAVSTFMLGVEKDVTIPMARNAVTCFVKSQQNLTADYIRMTSNIQIPTSDTVQKL
jgi:hypothetical protein